MVVDMVLERRVVVERRGKGSGGGYGFGEVKGSGGGYGCLDR